VEAKFEFIEYKDKKRLASNEMKFFRRTAGCTHFDHKRNEHILECLKVEPAEEKTKNLHIKLAASC